MDDTSSDSSSESQSSNTETDSSDSDKDIDDVSLNKARENMLSGVRTRLKKKYGNKKI